MQTSSPTVPEAQLDKHPGFLDTLCTFDCSCFIDTYLNLYLHLKKNLGRKYYKKEDVVKCPCNRHVSQRSMRLWEVKQLQLQIFYHNSIRMSTNFTSSSLRSTLLTKLKKKIYLKLSNFSRSFIYSTIYYPLKLHKTIGQTWTCKPGVNLEFLNKLSG